MDNDNKLVQKAADLYRSLRFAMKYRGVEILSAEDGNDLARGLLESGRPFLFARCGATEMRTAADYLQNGGVGFAEKTREDIRNLSGVFPTDDATLAKFCRTYIDCAHTADLLALWNVGAEREVIKGCAKTTRFAKLRALEPYYHPHPWSAELAGKRVLVVHPFKTTIERQYARREQLFPGTDILPQFADLRIVQAVQAWPGPTQATPAGLMPWPPWNSKWTLHRMMWCHHRCRCLRPASGRPRPRHRPRRHPNERRPATAFLASAAKRWDDHDHQQTL